MIKTSCPRPRPVITTMALIVPALNNPVYAADTDTSGPAYGLLIVTFLFLMGVSQAGVVFSAICRLCGARWSRPYYRIAELCTMAFLPFAFIGFLLIYYTERQDLFYWLSAPPEEHLSPWLNSQWLLLRQLFGLILFYGLAFVYVARALRPDLPESKNINHAEVESQLYLMSPLILIAFVLCNTFFAWDFAMMIIPHWHSTVFPIHFWFGNLYAATAALMAVPAVLARKSPGDTLFGTAEIRCHSMMITAFTLFWLYFYWAQFFVMWFGNMPHEIDPLWRQMYGHYAPWYWAMMFGCFFIPFAGLIFAAINRSLVAMCVIALSINVGIWVNKYLMIVPVYSPDARLFDNLLDVLLSMGLLAAFLAMVVVLTRKYPRYSEWEINMKAGTDGSMDSGPQHSGSST